ncbi:MAG: Panacea domain-containing protein [Chloroflexota bacterium]
MPNQYFTFNRDKAIEVIIYIAKHISDPTLHSVSKLLYFADKTHLEKYGRFICGDTYYAMEYGPVPTNVYKLLKESVEGDPVDNAFKVDNGREVVALRDPILDTLSESDLECLDQSISMYGHVPVWRRTQDSHDEAWRTAWEKRGSKQTNEMRLEDIAHMLEDSEDLINHLNNQYPD